MAAKRPATVRAGMAAATERPLAQLAANLPKIAGPHPFDAIHDARVALRRLGALLRAFAPLLPAQQVQHMKGEIRWLRRALGPARDLDVFIHETAPELRDLFSHERGLAALLDSATAKRAQTQHALARTTTGPRAKRLVATLQSMLGGRETGLSRERTHNPGSRPRPMDAPFDAFALALLRRRWKKIRKMGRLTKLSKALLHKLRIRLRNFRYLCDGFSMVLPERRYATLRRAMTALQDQLGALNDASMAPALAAGLARQASRTRDPALVARATGVVAGWGAARRQVFHDALDEPWYRMTKRGDRMFAASKG
jgi:CHAD domain-containing protein